MTISLPWLVSKEDAIMKETGKINYVEMPSKDLEATKRFFADAFGWSPFPFLRPLRQRIGGLV